MYILPFEALLKALNKEKTAISETGSVDIPVRVFKLLLRAALINSEFDEDSYLQNNPDVRKALRDGKIDNVFEHFLRFGYFEGRKGGMPEVDEKWYASQYADIAAGIKSGKIISASDHYHNAGAAEARSPNAECTEDAEAWNYAFQTARENG